MAETDKKEKEPFWTIGNVLSIIGTVLGFAYLFAITFCYVSKENVQFAQIGEGVVFGSVIGVIYGYEFGSSKAKKPVSTPPTTDNSTTTTTVVADTISSPPTETEK